MAKTIKKKITPAINPFDGIIWNKEDLQKSILNAQQSSLEGKQLTLEEKYYIHLGEIQKELDGVEIMYFYECTSEKSIEMFINFKNYIDEWITTKQMIKKYIKNHSQKLMSLEEKKLCEEERLEMAETEEERAKAEKLKIEKKKWFFASEVFMAKYIQCCLASIVKNELSSKKGKHCVAIFGLVGKIFEYSKTTKLLVFQEPWFNKILNNNPNITEIFKLHDEGNWINEEYIEMNNVEFKNEISEINKIYQKPNSIVLIAVFGNDTDKKINAKGVEICESSKFRSWYLKKEKNKESKEK